MTRELVFLPEVSADFVQAFDYYEGFSPGRGGARFEAAFRDAVRQVAAGLITRGRVFEHFHRVMLGRYPYTLYYRIVEDQAVVVSVLYSRFDPKRIQKELARRIA